MLCRNRGRRLTTPTRPTTTPCDRTALELESKFPALAPKFPANSLLSAKKFPARTRREFFRKLLESMVFFG